MPACCRPQVTAQTSAEVASTTSTTTTHPGAQHAAGRNTERVFVPRHATLTPHLRLHARLPQVTAQISAEVASTTYNATALEQNMQQAEANGTLSSNLGAAGYPNASAVDFNKVDTGASQAVDALKDNVVVNVSAWARATCSCLAFGRSLRFGCWGRAQTPSAGGRLLPSSCPQLSARVGLALHQEGDAMRCQNARCAGVSVDPNLPLAGLQPPE